MEIEELNKRIEKAQIRLYHDCLQMAGYEVVIYINTETFRKLVNACKLWLRPDENITEGFYRGCKYCVVSNGTEQVLVAKEIV